MDFDQTIVAISTAPGVGAIAVVRLSGANALPILSAIFRHLGSGSEAAYFKSHQAKHGFIFDSRDQQTVDEVVVTPFLSPHSYTGEDVIEISCHGNPLIARKVVGLCLAQGARLAQAGEFTRRAFLNGKIDLTQAEAVLDLIQAKTELSSQAALSVLKGDLGRQVEIVRGDLKQLLTAVVASIDFPDEVDQLANEEVEVIVDKSLRKLKELAKTANAGKYLREGLRLAIVGRPNAGKSSLLNCLLKVERAIVTDIPGTTRDSLEEQLEFNGIPIVLVDTAGIRNTDDHVEKLGIDRTKQVLQDSHLVLLVGDIICGWQEEEKEILHAIKNKNWILLWNKCDLASTSKTPDIALGEEQNKDKKPLAQLAISAKTGAGIEQLIAAVEKEVFAEGKVQEKAASLNTRQAALCEKAIEALQLVKKTLGYGMPHDCLATDLKTALDNLSEIAGTTVSEEVITSVFANFCIGK